MHVGALAETTFAKRKNWNATVSVLVHDSNENPLSNVTVSGTWSDGASGSGTCVTDGSGNCSFVKTKLTSSSVTFTQDDLVLTSFQYVPAENDVGTSIQIPKP